MALTALAQERIRVALFWHVALDERYANTRRHIIASMVVPHMINVSKIREGAAYGYIRQAVQLGYLEDDTTITSGPNRKTKPLKITEAGLRALGSWHTHALTTGKQLRAQDDTVPPPLPLDQAG